MLKFKVDSKSLVKNKQEPKAYWIEKWKRLSTCTCSFIYKDIEFFFVVNTPWNWETSSPFMIMCKYTWENSGYALANYILLTTSLQEEWGNDNDLLIFIKPFVYFI